MSLITEWRGEIDLPALPERKIKVGGNTVYQRLFPGHLTKARIGPSPFPNFDLVTTSLEPPYQQALLRRKANVRKPETPLPILRSPDALGGPELPATLNVQWEAYGELETYALTPETVLEAWDNKFEFNTENEARGLLGLRTPQIGALHAIAAHFSVGKEFEPATVVLPTGTGKTETMLATQIYRQLTRTLVLVPSDTLRGQISKKFLSLGVFPYEAAVVPVEIARPRVAVITTAIRTADEARQILAEANVIVALPNVMEVSSEEALKVLTEGCSDLIVDEAHHIAAKTWEKVRERFAKKRILQFTATPFRNDKRRIDGKIIFNYKLGDAQEAGYYRQINLKTVEEYGDENNRDRAIAKAAVEALKNDREVLKKDHLLMARCISIPRAEEVVKIYRELAPEYKPVLVYSGSGRVTANREALDQLHDRGDDGARIVVCVDMLGEGYDLPYLKIAALHDTHKSLAITLQFIGRFTRKGDPGKIGEATVVTNLADAKAEQKLADLYAEGADWDGLIKRLSEERIEEELRLQDVVFGLREHGDLGSQLSLWNLRPALSCQYFRTKCDEWNPLEYKTVLPATAESWYAYSPEDDTLVAVVCRAADVNWGSYQNVLDTIYDLLILRWDKEEKVLALYASDYDALRSDKMAVAVTDEETELVSGDAVFRILNNVELPLVKSLGSSQKGEAISFTSYFGSNVTEGLTKIDKKESALNNLACIGYENGDRVLWGGAQRRGKIWQQKGGSIADWITWTKTTGRRFRQRWLLRPICSTISCDPSGSKKHTPFTPYRLSGASRHSSGSQPNSSCLARSKCRSSKSMFHWVMRKQESPSQLSFRRRARGRSIF
ncbi:DEAD/DEAH box helicase family protein [Brevundimonas sp.]|uniref:DEAD/DEAH box helicase n=1 Tax=Brevundimonas sp. TaxID=1871086 RepID=UPI0028996C8B|nr:DEAD/DEAH box helicase family protein [Brevundimonas sp.]